MRIRIAEFDWLKTLALLLLIFVHSDLYFAFPEIIYPVQWFLISCFFFVSGFLAFDSFHRREASVRDFLKSKILSLYVPFMAASVLYFVLELSVGMTADPLRLLSHVFLLSIFDIWNSIYNFGFLWFIPYLLVFIIIFCFLEKYVKNAKFQVLLVSCGWFCTILAWVYNVPIKLGLVFSQYFLVFMIGVWLNKLEMYERVIDSRTAYVAIPLISLFSLDLSDLLAFDGATGYLKNLLYFCGRSTVLSLSTILLVLLFLRKLRLPRYYFVESIAKTSVLIYLMEPFFSYILCTFVFGQPTVYFAAGAEFYFYQIMRIFVLLVFLPLAAKGIQKYLPKTMIFSGTNNI